MDVYIIKWRDAHSNDHWLNVFEQINWQDVDFVVTSVGFVINEDDKYLYIAQSITESTKGGFLAIPQACIVEKTKIQEYATL